MITITRITENALMFGDVMGTIFMDEMNSQVLQGLWNVEGVVLNIGESVRVGLHKLPEIMKGGK